MATEQKRGCGALLRQARQRHRLDQRGLADRAGTTQTQVSRIERDVISPSIATLEKLLAAMGETLSLGTVALHQPPPGGGNTPISELRADYEHLSPEERLDQAAELSQIQTELAARQMGR
jgi:transcriptional regulator with XRE-family HTH domain